MIDNISSDPKSAIRTSIVPRPEILIHDTPDYRHVIDTNNRWTSMNRRFKV
jgi:hypothetical protein